MRDQDIIHPSTGKTDILVHTAPTGTPGDYGDYPWTYARVVGIYHANVIVPGTSKPVRVDFLHVRWFQKDTTASGSLARRLERIHFVPYDSTSGNAGEVFGFVDPGHVIRACHLIPAFHHRRTIHYLPPSFARDAHVQGDWCFFYVNRYVWVSSFRTTYLTVLISFVDRDMFVRYLGCGIGHMDLRARTIEHILKPGFSADTSFEIPVLDGEGLEDDNEVYGVI